MLYCYQPVCLETHLRFLIYYDQGAAQGSVRDHSLKYPGDPGLGGPAYLADSVSLRGRAYLVNVSLRGRLFQTLEFRVPRGNARRYHQL